MVLVKGKHLETNKMARKTRGRRRKKCISLNRVSISSVIPRLKGSSTLSKNRLFSDRERSNEKNSWVKSQRESDIHNSNNNSSTGKKGK